MKRCAALINGKPCKRKPKYTHEDKFGNRGSNGLWQVLHVYRLCRWCSAHRDAIQREVDAGCEIEGNP